MNHSSSFRLKINRNFAAATAVTLAPLIYFFQAVLGNRVISPDDGIIFNIPLRTAAANIMRGGYLPLWNPYIFSGMPLHGAAQAGLLFPLNWSYLIFSPPVATNVMMLATYVLAALGAYLYARRSGCLIAGAIVTSLAWQWSSFLITHIGHTNILQTAAILPWILWALDGYGMRDTRGRGILLAVLVALQCCTGHQQTFAYSLMLAIPYAIVRARAASERKTAYLRSLWFIAAGVLLAAVQIVPTFELLRNSPRASINYDYFTAFSLPPRFILTFMAPYLMGGGDGLLFKAWYVGPTFYGEYAAYVGVTSIILALLALFLDRDRLTKFWAVAVALGLLLALGRFAPLGLYKVIFFVPVLNLFRVPARHLMEVDFALAVLAGRGLTALVANRSNAQAIRRVAYACLIVFVLTLLIVTLGRPANFKLGREVPLTFLRTPELFMPVVLSLVGAWTVWRFARRKRAATAVLLLVLVIDLALWGQSSGWRNASAPRNFELWSEPDTVRFLHRQEKEPGVVPFRILTEDQVFDPNEPVGPPAGGAWVATLQPDIYMMYGIENASGYDGFGLARYQRFAADMKTWGELGDAERALRGSGREIDLLNVRYLLTRPTAGARTTDPSEVFARAPSLAKLPDQGLLTFPDATVAFGSAKFAAEEYNLPSLGSGSSLLLTFPPVDADAISLVTNLSWSVDLPDATPVAHLTLHAADGRKFDLDLLVGEHTSEWAYDRSDIHRQIKNRRAPLATSYAVKDSSGSFKGHTYVCSLELPEQMKIVSGELTVAKIDKAPELRLNVLRITLSNPNASFPLRSEWLKGAVNSAAQPTEPLAGGRWLRVVEFERVSVFENAHVLPRAWLASESVTLTENQILNVVRTGALPDGTIWDPLRTALIETQLTLPGLTSPAASGSVEIAKREPNQIELHASSPAASLLVLSENYFPGWRVYVDGRRQEILRVNYDLRGVLLPAGEHTVWFEYRPLSALLGLIISLLTLIALLLPRKK